MYLNFFWFSENTVIEWVICRYMVTSTFILSSRSNIEIVSYVGVKLSGASAEADIQLYV